MLHWVLIFSLQMGLLFERRLYAQGQAPDHVPLNDQGIHQDTVQELVQYYNAS